MPAANLQTVIVSKTVAKTCKKAERLARPHANKIAKSHETSQSFRFRQRPPTDFKKGSFRTFHIPGAPGITLVYGDLKRSKNPKGSRVLAGRQRHLQWPAESHSDIDRDWDFWLSIQRKIARAKDENMLQVLALSTRRRRIQSVTVKDLIMGAIADRARELRVLRTRPNTKSDERYYNTLVGDNPLKSVSTNRSVRKGSSTSRKSAKKRTKKKKKRSKKGTGIPKAIKLRSPKVMPDPGPSAWCGSTLEFAVKPKGKKPKGFKVDDQGNWLWEGGLKKEWLFLWSPKYKAVVAIRRPKGLKGGPGKFPGKGQVIRNGGGAKMFEIFTARPAEQTQEVDVDECPLHKIGGSGVHIVYRADKWSKKRKTTDYIHDFKNGVKLYCGPSIERPQIFLCFGGKLTMTERGLVF